MDSNPFCANDCLRSSIEISKNKAVINLDVEHCVTSLSTIRTPKLNVDIRNYFEVIKEFLNEEPSVLGGSNGPG